MLVNIRKQFIFGIGNQKVINQLLKRIKFLKIFKLFDYLILMIIIKYKQMEVKELFSIFGNKDLLTLYFMLLHDLKILNKFEILVKLLLLEKLKQ